MQDKTLYDTSTAGSSIIATNKVLKNTYLLLSMTLLFSAVTAVGAMAIGLGRGASLGLLIGAMLMLFFVLPRTQNSASGLLVVFAITGMLGASIGPTLNYYLAMSNGPALVAQAMGGTAIVFFALSGYALTSRKDFSFMGGFLMVGMIVVLLALVANLFFAVPAVSLALSAAIILLMSGFILYDTSRIVLGGETNYIRATIGLYITIFNLFTSMLHLLGVMDE